MAGGAGERPCRALIGRGRSGSLAPAPPLATETGAPFCRPGPARAPAICAGGGTQAGVGFPPSPPRLALGGARQPVHLAAPSPAPAQMRAGSRGPRQGGGPSLSPAGEAGGQGSRVLEGQVAHVEMG